MHQGQLGVALSRSIAGLGVDAFERRLNMQPSIKFSAPEFMLRPLPYPKHALEPYISKETLDYHYGKHQRAYVYKLNSLLASSGNEITSLEEIITRSTGVLFNNAAQVWNHDFYWQCLAPAGGTPGGELARGLSGAFGSVSAFKQLFKKKATEKFGSGWTWLVRTQDRRLMVVNTNDAENPLRLAAQPLLTCDVWEHAYYIDYRNDRARYIDAFWNVVNWNFVEENFMRTHFSHAGIGDYRPR
jgi:Fe-Mn family superoxide dismutase